MQLKQCFTTLGLTIFTITSAATASLSQESTDFKSYQITFSCQTATDVITGEKHPTTVAFIPNKKANVKFIFWKSVHRLRSILLVLFTSIMEWLFKSMRRFSGLNFLLPSQSRLKFLSP